MKAAHAGRQWPPSGRGTTSSPSRVTEPRRGTTAPTQRTTCVSDIWTAKTLVRSCQTTTSSSLVELLCIIRHADFFLSLSINDISLKHKRKLQTKRKRFPNQPIRERAVTSRRTYSPTPLAIIRNSSDQNSLSLRKNFKRQLK